MQQRHFRLSTPRRTATIHDHRESPRLVAAVYQASDIGEGGLTWQLSVTLGPYFYLRQRWTDWIITHRLAAAATQRLQDRHAEAWTLFSLGIAYQDIQQFDDALECLQTALTRWHQLGDQWAQAAIRGYLAATCLGLHEPTRAIEQARRGLATAQEIKDPWCEAHILYCLAHIHQAQGKHADAHDCCKRAMTIWGNIGSRYAQGRCLSYLGAICRRLHRHHDAIEHCRHALAIQREIGDRRGQAGSLHNLGRALHDTGDIDQARQCWSQAQDILESLGDPKARDLSSRLRQPAA